MRLAFVIPKLSALMVASMMFTGCATSELWSKKLHQPAEHPCLSLALRQDGKDLLVSYEERCGKSSKVQRRAYWLFARRDNANGGLQPRFINPATCGRLNPIPLIDTANTNTVPLEGYSAITNADSYSFHLWRDGQDAGSFNLPVYWAAPPGIFWQVALTPAAVACDVAATGFFCMVGDPDQ